MLEGLPTAQVEMAQPFATDAYGVSVPVTDLQSTVAGSTLAGTVYFDANTGMASAAVSAYDQAMVSFDVTSFTPDAPAFNVTCSRVRHSLRSISMTQTALILPPPSMN